MSTGLSPPWCSSPALLHRLPAQHRHRVGISRIKLGSPKFRCHSSFNTPGDESESKSVLDAFFLGKALAEAVNERVESAVGEFLSTVGRLQAEQQKQVQDFQEEVMERAKKAKEIAAREALEAQGFANKSPPSEIVSISTNPTNPDADPNPNDEDSVIEVPIDG